MAMAGDDDTTELTIDGVLDLHTFRPGDVKELVTDYLAECRARGILEVRIIHGKGIGALRRTVHAVLEKMPEVERFELAGGDAGDPATTSADVTTSWGSLSTGPS